MKTIAKMKKFFGTHKKIITASIVTAMTSVLMIIPASAETTSVSSTDFKSVLTALQGQISVATVVEVLAIAAGAAVGLAFMWWGVRKLVRVLMSAFKRGKVSL